MGTHGRREIHTHEVSVLKVEPIELIACLFGVVNVLVYDKCGALGVVCDALADLTAAVSLDLLRPDGFGEHTGWAQTCQRDQRAVRQ